MTATLEKVDTASLVARLETLRADRREQRQRLEDAAERASEELTRGEEAEDAIREQVDAKARLAAIERAIENLEKLIPHTQEAECRSAAERRVLGLKKGLGSLATEYQGDDFARLQKAVDAVEEALDRLNSRHGNIEQGRTEALFLEDRFGVEVVDALPDVAPPAERVRHLIERLHNLTADSRKQRARRLLSLSEREVKKLRGRINGTPTDEILKEAGERPPGDTRTWQERHEEAMRESRDRADAERREKIAAVDAWLEPKLADGPVPLRQLEREAQEAGFLLRHDRNARGESLREAADRLGVVGLVENENREGPVWWTLEGYDRSRFRPL